MDNKCVGKNLEGIEFLQGENNSAVRVGVCILDTTNKGIISSGWSALQFGKIIDGICGIAHQPAEFVIAGLVKYQHAASLEKAILEKSKWYEVHALPLSSLIASETCQSSALREIVFGFWAFFSQGDQYTNYLEVKEALLQPMNTFCVDEEEFDVVAMAKAHFVHHSIKCVCVKEDDQVIDIFSLGYGTKEALLLQRKVISVACTSDQMTDLESLCHSTLEEDINLRRWAGLESRENDGVSIPHNDSNKEMGEEEVEEPLDASADDILKNLQNSG